MPMNYVYRSKRKPSVSARDRELKKERRSGFSHVWLSHSVVGRQEEEEASLLFPKG